MKIIIVEDEPLVALEIEAALEALDHYVVGIADTKAQALELGRAGRCDGALIDLRLRDGFTGPEIADIFRDEFAIPFAFLTGNPEQLGDDLHGCVAVVSKPFSRLKLESALSAFGRIAG